MNCNEAATGPLRYLAGVGMGFFGLLVALLRFAQHPITAVLVALGAMALFLYSVAGLLKPAGE